MSHLYLIHNLWFGFKQIYEKEVKSFVYNLEGTVATTKMQIPNQLKHSCKLITGIGAIPLIIQSIVMLYYVVSQFVDCII